MKIGMVSKFQTADGLCVRARQVAEGLLERGHEVYAFTQSKTVDALPPEQIHRFDAIHLNPHFSIDAFYVPKVIVEKSRELELDVIHAQMNSGSTETLLPFFRKKLPPLVVTFHLAYGGGSLFYRVLFDLAWRASLFSARRYDHIVLVDPAQKPLFLRFGVADEKISIIRNGVDTQQFVPPKKKVEDGIVDFVFVGRLSLDKGVDTLLKAFKKYHEENKKTRLTLVGDGMLKHLQADSLNNDSIRWLGVLPHEKIPSVLQKSDVFVIPQNIGGLSLSVLEAMACGLPVITTAIGETKKLLSTTEGILVEPNNVDAVVNAMRTIAEDEKLRSKMGMKCREKVERKYSWQVQLALLEKVYEKVGSG